MGQGKTQIEQGEGCDLKSHRLGDRWSHLGIFEGSLHV